MKIRTRAILVIVFTNSMILLLSILAGTGYVRENIEKYIETDMLVVADIADRFISSEINTLKYESGEVADSLTGIEEANWSGTLEKQTRLYPKFVGIAVMNRDGKVLASAGRYPASSHVSANSDIRAAFEGKQVITSTVPTDDGVMFYMGTPVADEEGHIVVLTLDGMYFSDLATEYKVWETGHIFIDDKDGYVIANTRSEWVENRQNFILQEGNGPEHEELVSVLEKLTSGKRGIGYYSIDGEPRICAYRSVSGSEEGWCLGIVAPLSESPVRNVDRGILLIALVGFFLNVLAALIASKFIRKPFDEVAKLKEAAESDSRAKSDFLAHMSHEIRTPLNAVVGLSELALDDDRCDENTADKLGKIHSSGMTILSIVNDILDISKIESGKFEIYPTKYDTPSLINDIVTLNMVRIGEKPIRFDLDIDENLPGMLYGDDLRVKQIFNNLLSNAFKYTNSGTVEWKVSFEKDGENIWILSSVKDTGIGIKEENIKKLFTEYKQVDSNANRKIEGTGLGLAITKRLVDMMGGTISVDSEYGKGTTFCLRLRQEFVTDTTIGKTVADNLMGLHYTLAKRARNKTLVRTNLSYAHVLVVDDIPTNLEVIRGMLKPYNIKMDCANDGPEAIGMIRLGIPRYSAIFMDHMMPGMDGIEAARIIREDIGTDYARNIPIIALTANAIVGNEEMFLSHGFQDFISKPIDIAKLDAVLRHWIKNAENVNTAQNTLKPEVFDVEGMNMEKALTNFSGDGAALTDVLRSYAKSTPPLLRSLNEYLETGNLKEYAVIVHGIKGSSYGICATEAGKAAEELEMFAKADNIKGVRSGHFDLENKLNSLFDNLNRMLGKIDADVRKPLLAEPNPKLLEELRTACRDFDMDRVDETMKQLESFRYRRGEDIVSWLRGQVDDMAFEKISHGEWETE